MGPILSDGAIPVPDTTLGGLLAWYSLIHTAPDRLTNCVSEFARVVVANGTSNLQLFYYDATRSHRW
jgi:hypothetical protein